ncbi:LysM peptidoglycan-binding domain-containing protein [Bacillus pinisoli]|uniref:LysM peptidoglycan-binding domain-containing protein n=1 Tax=Bacillus pinisoli TaxID=2901866 RepID=UPI001FF11E45|nr:LysM peptidoglycan-binding domain-containing protein [Bacillus pinisoli]
MEVFTHYKINETEHGIEVIIYMNELMYEIANELGHPSVDDNINIEDEAVGYVKRRLPTLKVSTVKVMVGAILLSTIGLGTFASKGVQASTVETTTQATDPKISHKVKRGDTLSGISKKYGVSVEALKRINQLTSDIIKIGQVLTIPSGLNMTDNVSTTVTNTYQVVRGDTLSGIAKKNGITVEAVKQANQLTSDFLRIGQTLVIPIGTSMKSDVTQTGANTYQVASGDTLSGIAKKNGLTVERLKQANQLSSDFIRIGQTLVIPDGTSLNNDVSLTETNSYRVVSGDTLSGIAKRKGLTVEAIKQANQLSSDFLRIGQTLVIPDGTSMTNDVSPTETNSYRVVFGDTLSGIAKRNGVTVEEIKQVNQLTNDFLRVGQTLVIPTGDNIKTANSIESVGSEINQEDLQWLAKMIYSEARGETVEGQIAVGAVILNRVKSSLFPNTVKEVLFQYNNGYYQFTPAQTGALNHATPTQQNIDAALRALSGEDPTKGSLYFYNPKKTNSQWLKSRTVSTVIGDHTFAY